MFLASDDDILIADPEAEYYPLVQRLGGQVIKISPTSRQYVNPMDLNLDYSDDESPLSLKVDFLLSFCDIVVGSKDGLQPIEKTVIDRCVRLVYRQYLENPCPENMPILEDLYQLLLQYFCRVLWHVRINAFPQFKQNFSSSMIFGDRYGTI